MFLDEPLHDELGDAGIRPSSLRGDWEREVSAVLAEAGLEIPKTSSAMCGGRQGEHSEHLGYILAEMQVLARKHPGATW
jgi:ring-1,2-phenylacetyl-CoA epoxidase subunit PaaC